MDAARRNYISPTLRSASEGSWGQVLNCEFGRLDFTSAQREFTIQDLTPCGVLYVRNTTAELANSFAPNKKPF